MMASVDHPKCVKCKDKDKRILDQQEKFDNLQKRFREVVGACRTLQTQLKTKEQQLVDASVSATSGLSSKQQDRVAELEDRVSELSKTCGHYETQRNADKKLIDELYSQLETFKNISVFETVKEDAKTFNERIDSVSVSRSRHVQTDSLDDVIDHISCSPKTLVDIEIQTDTVTDIIPTVSKKPLELAVVLPTARENKLSDTQEQDETSFQLSEQNDSVFLFSPGTPPPVEPQSDLYVRPRTISESASVAAGPSASSVSLFYANELARKEIELGEARLQAREFECGLPEIQWKYNVEKYRLQTRVACLEKQQQAIQRETSNQPNMTYVRNVLLRYINSKDKQQKQVMINALLTALNVNEQQTSQ